MSAALFDHLWQSTLCIGVAAVLAWVCRNAGAHVRYGIWLAASLKFLVPLSVFVALGSHAGWATLSRDASGDSSAARSSAQMLTVPASTLAAAWAAPTPSRMVTYAPDENSSRMSALVSGPGEWWLVAWFAGSAVLAVRWLLRWRAAQNVVSRATPRQFDEARGTPAATRAGHGTTHERLGAREAAGIDEPRRARIAPLPVRTTPFRIEPGVFGIFRPTLLLPESVFSSLPPGELQALIAHESAHVKRRDNLTAALHSLTEILFWFHPLVWWIGARLVSERERACDEAVVRAGSDRNTYAQAILNVCRLYLGAPVVSASGASRGHLKTRIEAILNAPLSSSLGSAKRGVLAAAAIVVIAGPVAFGLTNPVHAAFDASESAAPTLEFASAQIVRGENSRPATIQAGSDSFIAMNATVSDLIRFAYGRPLPLQTSGGPAWLETERYTIRANVDPAAVTNDSAAITQRVQSLLADRFHFRAHVAKGPVYVLESADSAPKASQKPVEKGIGLIDQKSGRVSFRGASSASIAEALSTFLASPVLDHTRPGVTYDFKMKWPRNDLKALGDQLFDQAGLTLKSFTMEQLVIDGAARPALDDATPAAGSITAAR